MVLTFLAVIFVVSTAALIGFFVYYHSQQSNRQMEQLANQLGAHLIPGDNWKKPQLVMDHNGLRTRVQFEELGSAHSHVEIHPTWKQKLLTVTTDGFDPTFEMRIGPRSLAKNISAWFKGQSGSTGCPDMDKQFSVASNRCQDSLHAILSPEIRDAILAIDGFAEAPTKPVKAQQPVKPNHATATNANDVMPGMNIDTGRFQLRMVAGECHCHLLVHPSEEARLQEIVRSIVDIQAGISDRIIAVSKLAKNTSVVV